MHIYFFVVAEFFINLTATTSEVNEVEEEATVCVELIGELEKAIIVRLRFVDSSDTDLVNITSDSNLRLRFRAGSISGALECVAVGIVRDGIVEGTESFSVALRDPPPRADVITDQTPVTIVITDSPLDGESVKVLYLFSV